jgi:hypothetical protein
MDTSKKTRKISPPTDSKTKTTAKRGANYKDKFKYGLEYETLVYSPRIKALYEAEKQRLNSLGTVVSYKCDLTKDTFNSKYDKEKTAPYRRFVQESIQERATADNATDVNIRYEFASSWVKCPVVSEDKPEWIITHDGSVESNPPPPPPREFIPLYHNIDDLLKQDTAALLPARYEKHIVQNIEIVSPPITRKQITNDYIKHALSIFRGKDDELVYFNNELTSNHVHLSCDNEFDNPRALYNVYVIWMIVEPLIALSLPYWRRNNGFCSSIYNTLKTRFKNNKDKIKEAYINLINVEDHLDTSSLFSSVFENVRELRRTMKKYQYPGHAPYPEHPSNNYVLNTDDADPASAEISRMVIASVFQNYIGKRDWRTQYKHSKSRYSSLNTLNTLNESLKTHTIEVRIKHGSDDPKEITAFIDLLTDLFIVGIELKNKNKYIHLDTAEIDVLLELGEIITTDPDLSNHTNVFDSLVPQVFEMVKRHVMDVDLPKYALRSNIQKMARITRASMRSLDALVESTAAAPTTTPMEAGGGEARKKWVFCYGSNGLKQLRRRVEHKGSWESRPAILPKYALIFSATTKGWNGAIASIWPDDKSKVYGVVVKMNAAEIELLDKYEGVHLEDWYIQDTVHPIDAITKEPYRAMAYVNQDIEFVEPPSIAYLKAIEENLKNAGLTAKQIGTGIKINMVDLNTVKVKKIGQWKYDTNQIEFTSKKMAKQFEKAKSNSKNNKN